MKYKTKLKFFKIEKLKLKGINYGFFSRLGGYSQFNFNSLNCSYNSGDRLIDVKKNINEVKKVLKLDNTNTKFLNQVHGNKVEIIDKKNLNIRIFADGAISKNKKISLAILTADCVPIFLIDEKNNVISAIHSGWKGCYKNIVAVAIKKIKSLNLNSKITAIVGPCLQKNNFEVQQDFKNKFIKKNKNFEIFFNKNIKTGKLFFDMPKMINFQIQEQNINKIFNIREDTYNNTNLFFSHRRNTHLGLGNTGRMINIIGFNV